MADFEIPGIDKARMAGHTWKSIRAAIGVAALPNQSRGGHKRGTGRKGKKQEVEPNVDR